MPDFRALANTTLSNREREVLELLGRGHTDKDAGRKLGISLGTVRVYRKRIEFKMNAHGLVGCLLVAWKLGQIDLDAIADETLANRPPPKARYSTVPNEDAEDEPTEA